MKALTRCVGLVAVCLTAALVGLSGVQADPTPAPQPREVPQPRVLPEWAFNEIVIEANKFIQEPFAVPVVSPNVTRSIAGGTIRANALLIALAAQNRLPTAGDDAARLATLRDLAIKLAAAEANEPADNAEARKLVGKLRKYPDIEVNPNASRAIINLHGPFNHDDVASVFGGCSGNKTQRLELNLLKLGRLKVYTPEQTVQIEMLAYKAALLGELIVDMTELVPATDPKVAEHRKEFSQFAREVEGAGWNLAAIAHRSHDASTQAGIKKLINNCNDCHCKFRN